jgi:ankyrin repeat protein
MILKKISFIFFLIFVCIICTNAKDQEILQQKIAPLWHSEFLYDLLIKDLKSKIHDYILLNLNAPKPRLDPDKKWPILHHCVYFDDSDLVESVINEIKEVCQPKHLSRELKKYTCYKDTAGNTPLHIAAISCTLCTGKIIELLMKNGTECEAKNNEGNTALHEAAKKLNAEAVKKLLYFGANPVALNLKQQTPELYATYDCVNCNKIYPACCQEHKKVVEPILNNLYRQTDLKNTYTLLKK